VIARSAGLAGAATFVSRVLGLVRDLVLAALFGAGNQMDAFLVAFRLPNLVRDLFAEGTMSAAFVPAFTRHVADHGREAAWSLGVQVINALVVITGTLALVGMMFAEPLVRLYAGDYASVPGKLDLTVQLTRITLPFLTLVAVAAVLMGMLNALHHYFVPALAPAMFNVVVIAGALVLVPLMPNVGWPAIVAVAVASLLGGVAQVAAQWPALRREGFRWSWRLDWRNPGLAQVLTLMGPGTLALAATQVNLFVNTLLATSQGTGAVSWLSYAFRLMYFPIGLFGVSIATAVLPEAARHASRNDPHAIGETLSKGLGLMLLVNVPATIGLIVLADPIVRLIFERGAFGATDTAATAAAVRFYAVGLVGYAAARIAAPVFYAIGRHRSPVGIAVLSMGVNVVASLVLVAMMGFRGLALGTSIAALVHGGVAVWALWQRLDGMHAARLGSTILRVTIASVVMGAAVMLLPMPRGAGALTGQALNLAMAIGIGVVTFGVTARLLRIAELDDLLTAARSRIARA
jgi:putative peptidoglycan lipid II flippase